MNLPPPKNKLPAIYRGPCAICHKPFHDTPNFNVCADCRRKSLITAPKKYVRKEPIQNGTRFQPNQQWDSIDEMDEWIKNNLPEGSFVVDHWKSEVIRCQVEVPNPKKK